jgi:hypothetical protein
MSRKAAGLWLLAILLGVALLSGVPKRVFLPREDTITKRTAGFALCLEERTQLTNQENSRSSNKRPRT